MLKVEIKLTDEESLTFPRLMKLVGNEMIVLFTSLTKGVVVVGNDYWETGELNAHWPRADNELSWQSLPKGTQVIITQK